MIFAADPVNVADVLGGYGWLVQLGAFGVNAAILLFVVMKLGPAFLEKLSELQAAFDQALQETRSDFTAELRRQRDEFKTEIKADRDAFRQSLKELRGRLE